MVVVVLSADDVSDDNALADGSYPMGQCTCNCRTIDLDVDLVNDKSGPFQYGSIDMLSSTKLLSMLLGNKSMTICSYVDRLM